MEEDFDFEQQDSTPLTDIMQGLDQDFQSLLEGLGDTMNDSLLLALSDTGLDIAQISPRHLSVLSLQALGLGPARIIRLTGYSRKTVYRILHQQKYAPIMMKVRQYVTARLFQWVLALLPQAFDALRQNFINGDLDQKRKAAQVLFSLVKESASRPKQPDVIPPRVEPGIWKLLEGD